MQVKSVDLSLLSAMITPAVLISASGMLVFSTSARLSRIVDRVRVLSGSIEQVLRGRADWSEERRQAVEHQLSTYARRGRLIQAALSSFYISMGIFVATIISIGLIAFFPRVGWLPSALGIAGTFALFAGCLTLIGETRLALRSIHSELEAVARPRNRIHAASGPS